MIGAESILANFVDAGIVPIICQPERNPLLQRSHSRLQSWITMGCLLQVAAGSLAVASGRPNGDALGSSLAKVWSM
jgi:tyrosine-protein phosphatase YwqE